MNKLLLFIALGSVAVLNGSPLHDAVMNNNLDRADALLARGANPDEQDELGNTPLLNAVEQGSYAMVKLLLENDADPDVADNEGRTPLLQAVENYKNYPSKNKTYTDIIKILFKYKADASLQDNAGISPLHKAVSFSDGLDVAQLLLSHGANPDSQTKEGSTPLHVAALVDGKLVTLLLNHGASANKADRYGNTPLHLSMAEHYFITGFARGKKKEVEKKYSSVQALLDGGANPNSTNNEGLTPLHVVMGVGRSSDFAKQSLKMLGIYVAAGAAGGAFGGAMIGSAIGMAAEGAIVIALIVGSIVAVKSIITITVTQQREIYWVESAVKLLLAGGADVNALDHAGNTPLHIAAFGTILQKRAEQDVRLTLVLLEHGAKTNIKNKVDLTAFSIAQQFGRIGLMRAIKEYEIGRRVKAKAKEIGRKVSTTARGLAEATE